MPDLISGLVCMHAIDQMMGVLPVFRRVTRLTKAAGALSLRCLSLKESSQLSQIAPAHRSSVVAARSNYSSAV